MSAKSLEGQVALITGSVRRIGRAAALALAGDGADIIIHARKSLAEAESVKAEVEALGRRAIILTADVTDEVAVTAMVNDAIATFGRIDILVNNAALRGESDFTEMSFAEWREITGIIIDGAFLCSRAVLPFMLARGYGRIINLGGVSAHLGAARRAHVVTAKAAIAGLTRGLASEYAGKGITVNCVAPGRIGGQRAAGAGHGIGGQPPVGREGVPDDVATVIRMLCQPSNGYITGQTIHVNGGMFMP